MGNVDTSSASDINTVYSEIPYVVLRDLIYERNRQTLMYPDDQYLPDLDWLPILTEELGEVAKAMLERKADEVRKELIEVAAVAIAWVEAIDGRE